MVDALLLCCVFFGLVWLWKAGLDDDEPIKHKRTPAPLKSPTPHQFAPVVPPPVEQTPLTLPVIPQKKEPKIEITITPEFENAFDLLENEGKNLFITGKAGTGKSTFLEHFRKNTKKKFAVIAPTGVAAINVRGQTIHSFFNFRWGFMEPDKPIYARKDKRKLFQKLEVLIIDEISMVRADMFDAIDAFLRLNGKNPGVPFGGVRLCVVGDLYQLPPVVGSSDEDVYYRYYKSPFFFASSAYEKAAFERVEFTEIFRQRENEFVTFLNKVREATINDEDLAWFNEKTSKNAVHPDAITLASTNNIADITNANALDELDGTPRTYYAEATGSFEKDTKKLPAPNELELKPDARVMFLKNDSDKRWVNGTIGTVKKLKRGKVEVLVDDVLYDVEPENWEDVKFVYDEKEDEIIEKMEGSFKQMPLQLAWAVTIHKSQGKTFDNVVINLGSGAFAKGQSYVALSRCKTLGGISVKHPIKQNDVQVDKRVVAFMQNEVD